MMTTRQLRWVAAYTLVVSAAILVLSSQIREQARAQVVVPQPYGAAADDDANEPKHKLGLADACKASDLIGMDVRAMGSDETIGSVNDLVLRHDGRVLYAAVSFGGFLGMGDKLFAVPMDAINFVRIGDKDDAEIYAQIDITEQSLKNRQGFDQENWPDRADQSFLAGSERVGQAPRGAVNQ